MKTGLVIINAFTKLDKILHMKERLIFEFSKLGVQLDEMNNQEVHIYIDDHGNIFHNLKKYDFIVYLDKDTIIASMLEKAGYRLFNGSEAIRLCDDKMLTHVALANNGIAMPKTILSPLRYGGGEDGKFLEYVAKELSFPLVVKKNYGSQGSGVFLIKDIDELKSLNNKLGFEPHLFQRYIASSFGHDTRIIVIDHQVIAHMSRYSNNDFRSNMALGGHASVEKLPESFEKMAILASKILNLDYCGVDIATSENGDPLLLEVNSNAFVSSIEEISKVNVVEAYASYIYKKIYQK